MQILMIVVRDFIKRFYVIFSKKWRKNVHCALGGLKGYVSGILISTWNVPPSYGVSGGPLIVPDNSVKSSFTKVNSTPLLATSSLLTTSRNSLWILWWAMFDMVVQFRFTLLVVPQGQNEDFKTFSVKMHKKFVIWFKLGDWVIIWWFTIKRPVSSALSSSVNSKHNVNLSILILSKIRNALILFRCIILLFLADKLLEN